MNFANKKQEYGKKDDPSEVVIVGNIDDSQRDSINYIEIWDKRDRLIHSVWKEYNKKTLERFLRNNRDTSPDDEKL